MEYKKERNFIVANEHGTIVGKWDILTGEFYGKSGKVVKNTPSCFTYDNIRLCRYSDTRTDKIFGDMLYLFRSWISENHRYTRTMGKRLEEIISVGLTVDSFSNLTGTIKLTKELVNYLKENCRGRYCEDWANKYILSRQYKDFLEGKPDYIVNLFYSFANEYPFDYLKSILTRIMNEHVSYLWNTNPSYSSPSLTNVVKNYYNYCMDLYGEVKVSPNILSNYAQINYLHDEWKNAHYNEGLMKNNNKPFLYFNHGQYFARPLLTREDFHFEGESQHNCVERMYMEKAYNNETYIVVVRDVDDPDHSLITCEVSHNGNIRQYLARCNSHLIGDSLLNFKHLYQEHIKETMGE